MSETWLIFFKKKYSIMSDYDIRQIEVNYNYVPRQLHVQKTLIWYDRPFYKIQHQTSYGPGQAKRCLRTYAKWADSHHLVYEQRLGICSPVKHCLISVIVFADSESPNQTVRMRSWSGSALSVYIRMYVFVRRGPYHMCMLTLILIMPVWSGQTLFGYCIVPFPRAQHSENYLNWPSMSELIITTPDSIQSMRL